jgi:hypothetical protein
MPWKKIKHSIRSIVLAVISLIMTITLTAITMARCRHRWQFAAICGWKLGLSLTLGFASILAALQAPGAQGEETSATETARAAGAVPDPQSVTLQPYYAPRKPEWARPEEPEGPQPDGLGKLLGSLFCCLILYLPGLIAGIAGLISLVSETIESNHDVKITTGAFGGAICLFAPFTLGKTGIMNWAGCGDDDGDASFWLLCGMLFSLVIASLPWLGLFGVLYSDWVLAAIAENLTGTPSSDNGAVY